MSIFDDLLSDPQAMQRLGTQLDAGSQIYGALSHIQFASQAQKAAQYQAQQLRQNALDAQGASQIQANTIQQDTDRVMSRALAVAAASGGGASDPTVISNMAKIASEGAYRKSVALYEGAATANKMEMQADTAEYAGKAAKTNELMAGVGQLAGAGTSLLKGFARGSLLTKYGGTGPRFNQSPNGPTAYDNWG